MTVTELKARAYDLIAFKEQAQRELDAVNAQIGELFRQEQEAEQALIAQLVEVDTEAMVT